MEKRTVRKRKYYREVGTDSRQIITPSSLVGCMILFGEQLIIQNGVKLDEWLEERNVQKEKREGWTRGIPNERREGEGG